jgi:hypothetical protein
VREVVPRELERLGLVARGDQRELGIAVERPVEVAHLAVDPRRQRGLGQARADRRGDVGRGRAGGHLAHRSVGQADLQQLAHRVRLSVCGATGTKPRALKVPAPVMQVIGCGR